VSGLCPDPLESPREGREERRIEGVRERGPGAPRLMTDHRHCNDKTDRPGCRICVDE